MISSELFDLQKLCKYASVLCPHLTHLAFSGELDDEEEVSCSTDREDNWDKVDSWISKQSCRDIYLKHLLVDI